MARLLIAYGTTEGYTRKVADHIADVARQAGHVIEVWDSTSATEAMMEGGYDAVIIGASVHQDHHQASIVDYVKANRNTLQRVPSAFFSVSLHAALPDEEHQAETRRYVSEFIEETGWTPDRTWAVAGALLYTQYDFFKRLVMKFIAKREGQDTDTSKDHEYTDWPALTRSVEGFLQEVVAPRMATQRAATPTGTAP